MARELKIGDRVVDWKDRAGVVLAVSHLDHSAEPDFTVRYDDGSEHWWSWSEFGIDPTDTDWEGTFRFEDTEYPEWPR